ncbi:PREDICTED: katanin p60 ATPase-containing subunit A1 isoform X1 [Theobroma cacao]|uniref:Katanin p60 ATPase-containing subunit A1 isoform X1 n=1 Tax=Theobroma cacao TaxID=3641 RepID=A0AB32V266_THECC|nr:PREDICTED: katanin p60 ATPase-containing subunit A1 isoform X1 [Theobroma cacao]
MVVLERLARTARSWRKIASPKILTPSRASSRDLPSALYHRSSGCLKCILDTQQLRLVAASSGSYSMLPAVLAGLLGAGVLETAYAEADEVAAKPPLPSETPASHVNLEETAKKERQRIEQLLKDKGMKSGSYPRFTVAIKGQKVTIKFQIPPSCEVAQLIANLVSNLGLKVEERGGGSDMLLRAWDSSVAWQLTLNPLEKQKETGVNEGHSVDRNGDGGNLCILIFHSLISSDKAEIEFLKQGSLNPNELDALVSVLQLAGGKLGQSKSRVGKPREGSSQMPSAEKSIASLEAMGVRIYGLDAPHQNSSYSEISWDNIAGYDQQKREIEDTILLALNSPEVYDDIARGTRCKFESNRPRAVLFEGPPGTGKTSCARVIANQAGVPLLYVPLEVVMSKYYGESERLMGQVFSLANQLPDGAIVFLDEVDAFAIARDGEIHEATRRVLSVLLRQIDGFEQDKKVVVIAATNRKQDLDPALISRFDAMIGFGLPDEQNRQEIAAQYAKHLTESELIELARVTDEMSGRDIRDACQQAERSWASKLIRGQATKNEEQKSLPPLEEYIKSAMNRRKALLSVAEQRNHNSNLRTKKPHLDYGVLID